MMTNFENVEAAREFFYRERVIFVGQAALIGAVKGVLAHYATI